MATLSIVIPVYRNEENLDALLPALAVLRRTMIEDRMLQRSLEGYADYSGRVRYRLIPGVW